ncbi:hypothetical protein [Isoptericola sp. NPDC019482]|uniref:hypothetical protein n=1 Tax=Isoptericola sp. NPDC019482 TaxID=3154688 RepID=UPI00348EEA62
MQPHDGVTWYKRWWPPLVAAPIVYGVCALLAAVLPTNGPGAGWSVLVVFVGVLAPIALLVLAAVRGKRAYGHHRRSRGRFTVAERRGLELQAQADAAVEHARALRRTLGARQVPPSIRVWDVVPYPEETFFCDTPIMYARYYGMDVEYSQTSGFFFGRPSFVLAGLAATAVGNASRRSAAARQAQEQWREHAQARLVISDKRLLVHVHGRWLSFDYGAMSAIYPEPGNWMVVCQFPDTAPLMLSGQYAPYASVMALFVTHGEVALREHPALAGL